MQSGVVKGMLVMAVIITVLSFPLASRALHSLFQTIDVNEDGRIDGGEYSKNMIDHAFNKLDDNRNGVINQAEWDMIENVEDREKHDNLFPVVDSDHNRVISLDEFGEYARKHSDVPETFTALDKDRNGYLSPEEIPVRPQFEMVTIRL